MINIVGMYQDVGVASQWWRIDSPLGYLGKQPGYNTQVIKHFTHDNVPERSIVVLLRMTAPNMTPIERLIDELKAKGCTVIYDLDDDVLTGSFIDNTKLIDSGYDDKGGIDVRNNILQLVDGVTVSSLYLQAKVREITEKPVKYVPNLIDLEWFENAKGPKLAHFDNDVYIGWSGTYRPQRDLEVMARAWARIADMHANAVFVVGGWKPKVIYDLVPNDRIIYRPMTDIQNYPATLKVDIGCCPLEDSLFNWCKSPIKAMEYGLAGAAVVASHTLYKDFLENGVDGYIAKTEEDWVHYLDILIRYPELRKRFNLQLVGFVNEYCTLQKNWRWYPMTYIDMVTERKVLI